MVDALGNPLAFFLTPGQAHDLEGADALLPQMEADTVLADKAFDADERVSAKAGPKASPRIKNPTVVSVTSGGNSMVLRFSGRTL